MKNYLSAEQFAAALHGMEACDGACKWAEGLDYNTAWNTCYNPGWMFFLIEKIIPLTLVVNELLVCRFAREVVYLTADSRVLACIEVREAWARGKATDEERVAALAAAWAAAQIDTDSAASDAASDAACSATWDAARDAARSAAYAASAIAAAFVTGPDEEWDAVYDAAAKNARAKQCDIIRELVAQPELV